MIFLIDLIIGVMLGTILFGVTGKGAGDWEFYVLSITFIMMALAFHYNHSR